MFLLKHPVFYYYELRFCGNRIILSEKDFMLFLITFEEINTQMRKPLILILFFLLLLIISSSGCNIFCVRGNGEIIETGRELEDFSEIEADGNFDIFISKGSRHLAIVEAESNLQPEIVTKVKDGKLIIKSKECISPTTDIKVNVSVRNLNGMVLNGAGKMICNDIFSSEKFYVTLNGAGDVSARTSAAAMDVVVNGAGDINMEGSAKDLNLKINGAGDVKAFGLTTDKSTIKINGAGDVEVSVFSAIDAAIHGSGNVYYKGDNPIVKSKITGSGEVIKK